MKVPEKCKAEICIPDKYKVVDVDGLNVYNKNPKKSMQVDFIATKDGYHYFSVQSGSFHFITK